MASDLAAWLRARIRSEGPISFREWMEECLYHPKYGYYMRPGRKTGPGTDADFVTPPTLHPFFGRAVARQLVLEWERLGRPAAFEVAEYGGGEGDLCANALAELD
ncbi:MAG TPA: SAM-dependent methyltransferase, partial [Candidatus Thermoplasmatota archaeon]|nr:SAM-dependent methyltransferase [Candidatus Thermoplasmatota archaeon]